MSMCTLHRLTPDVRKDFTFHDELRWASTYGLLESVRRRKVGRDLADEDGVLPATAATVTRRT